MPSSNYITFTHVCITCRYFEPRRQNYTIVLSYDRDQIVCKAKKSMVFIFTGTVANILASQLNYSFFPLLPSLFLFNSHLPGPGCPYVLPGLLQNPSQLIFVLLCEYKCCLVLKCMLSNL